MHQILRILSLIQDPTSKVNKQVDARTEVGNLLFNMSPEILLHQWSEYGALLIKSLTKYTLKT